MVVNFFFAVNICVERPQLEVGMVVLGMPSRDGMGWIHARLEAGGCD